METSEDAWSRTLVARCCCCLACASVPSAAWVQQHQRLKDRWRVAALRWLSAQTLDPDDAGPEDDTDSQANPAASSVGNSRAGGGLWVECASELAGQARHGLQLRSLWRIHTAAVS